MAIIPWARRSVRKLARRLTTRAVILMYHGIADVKSDPWSIYVSPEHFKRQMAVLESHFHPIRLLDLVKACKSGTIPKNAVAVTFDDGYANNMETAQPILAQHNIPATLFAVSDLLGQPSEFWWDELEQVLMGPEQLPADLQLRLGQNEPSWNLAEAAAPTADNPTAAQARHDFYHQVWQLLLTAEDNDRSDALVHLADWAKCTPQVRDSRRVMTPDELIAVDRAGVFEIGAHSTTHAWLPSLSIEQQRVEITQSGAHLQDLLGHPVQCFCYPYGGYDGRALSLVAEAGYTCATTTVEEPVWNRSYIPQLPRFMALDWPPEVFEQKLRAWLAS